MASLMKQRKYKIKEVTYNQDKQQNEIVYFRMRRPIDNEQPDDQFIVNRFPTKKQAKKPQHNNLSFQEKREQQKVENMFARLGLENNIQYFLKKVTLNQEVSEAKKSFQNAITSKSSERANHLRSLNREQRLDKLRGVSKLKIVDLDDETVQLGGQQVSIQNLGPLNQFYYVLSKRNQIKQGAMLDLPQSEHYLFDKLDFENQSGGEDEVDYQEDEDDSNRESNPDYDYPDQDYGDSEDEGVINKKYYRGDSEDQMDESFQLDEQQVYRSYLRRCRKEKQSSDDQYF